MEHAYFIFVTTEKFGAREQYIKEKYEAGRAVYPHKESENTSKCRSLVLNNPIKPAWIYCSYFMVLGCKTLASAREATFAFINTSLWRHLS